MASTTSPINGIHGLTHDASIPSAHRHLQLLRPVLSLPSCSQLCPALPRPRCHNCR